MNTYPNPLPETFAPPGVDWLDQHALEIRECLRREHEWHAQELKEKRSPISFPWAEAIAQWLAQAPIVTIVGAPDDASRSRRLATLLLYFVHGGLPVDGHPSPETSWKTRPWVIEGEAPAPAYRSRTHGYENDWERLLFAGVSMEVEVPTEEGGRPLWSVLLERYPRWPVMPEAFAAINPPRWVSEQHPEAWLKSQKDQLCMAVGGYPGCAGFSTAKTLWDAIHVIEDRVVACGYQGPPLWCGVEMPDGTPLVWQMVHRFPMLISTMHAQEVAAKKKGEFPPFPSLVWDTVNSQGKDLWFAALSSRCTNEEGFIVKGVSHLITRRKPQPDAEGRGWLVSDSDLLKPMTSYRSSYGHYPLRRKLRDILARHPEWAFAGSEVQHATFAETVWNAWTNDQLHRKSAIELAQWGALLKVGHPTLTEPLRGLLIETMGYALCQNYDGASNMNNHMWTKHEQARLEPALEQLLSKGAWRVPQYTVPQLADHPTGILERCENDNQANTMGIRAKNWRARRHALMRQDALSNSVMAAPSTLRRRMRG